MSILMKCGHITTTVDKNGKPYCLICDCREVANKLPDLTGRKAKCVHCKKIVDSDYRLPFFHNNDNGEFDEFYCGCGGWD